MNVGHTYHSVCLTCTLQVWLHFDLSFEESRSTRFWDGDSSGYFCRTGTSTVQTGSRLLVFSIATKSGHSNINQQILGLVRVCIRTVTVRRTALVMFILEDEHAPIAAPPAIAQYMSGTCSSVYKYHHFLQTAIVAFDSAFRVLRAI